MADEDIVIGIRGDTSGGKAIKQTLDGIAASGDKATSTTKFLEKEMRSLQSAASGLQNTMRGLIAGFGLREVVRMADNYTLLRERVKQATNSTQEFNQAFRELQRVSNETGSKLNDAVDVFQRLSFVRTELKATIDDMVTFTGTVQKLGVMSGASTTAMSAGLLQLGQAMSAGVVRAEEFNSVMENIPAVAKAVSDQFGITTGQLRLLVLEGQVASEDFFNALINDAARVEAAYATMPMTIGRAFSSLYNEMEAFIGQSSKTSGAAMGVIGVIDALRIAVYGLGQGFEAVTTFIAAAMQAALKTVEQLVNASIAQINRFISTVNALPGVNIGAIGSVDLTGGVGARDILREGFSAQRGASPKTIFDDAIAGRDVGKASTEVRALTQDYKKLAAGLSENNNAKKAEKKIQSEITSAIKATLTEEQRLSAEIANLERLKGFAKTKEDIDALNSGIARTNEELNELRIKAEIDGPVGKAFKSLADEIDDGFKDAFKSAFTESDGGWKKLLSGWKATFKSFLAEMAYQALARPIVMSVVGGIGGAMGLSSGAVASSLGITGTGGSTGSSGGFSLSNLGSTASSLFNGGLYSNTLGSIGSGVGNLLSGQSWGAMGPSKAAAIGGGAFGNLGYGAIGGFGASLLGLGSQNSLVNMASGTLGSLAGGAIGTSIGSILGMAGGPVGALIGGFAGTALGGLFGSSKPKRGTLGGVIRATDGRLNYATNGRDGSDQFVKAVIDPLNAIMEELGGSFYDKGLGSLETNTVRDKKTVLFHNQVVSNKAGDVDAVIRAVLNRSDLFTGADSQLLDVVRKSTQLGSGGDQILSDINLAKQVLGLDDETADALEAINEQFDTLTDRAINLGLPLDKLTEVIGKQRDAAIGAINAMEAGFSSLEEMTATFKSFLDGQALGANSSLSPMGKLYLAQDNYGSLLETAQGGDLSVTKDLLTAASVVIDVGRSIFASSKGFADLESIIRTDVKDIARAAGVPGYAIGTNNAAAGMAWVGERGPELVRFGGGEQVYTASQSQQMAQEGGRMSLQTVALLSRLVDSAERQEARLALIEKSQRQKAARMKVLA